MLKIICCVDNNYGIGKENKIPWSNKDELNHFNITTLNKVVVMGRKTFNSINNKPLLNRTNIIFSNNKDFKFEGINVTNNINDIVKLSKKEDVFIVGGKEIYNIFLKYVDEIILSKLEESYDCDTFWNPTLSFFKLDKIQKNNGFDIFVYKSFYHKILDGKMLQDHFKIKVINEIKELKKQYKEVPKVSIIQIGNDFSSNIYIKNKIKLATELNIDIDLIKLEENTNQQTLNNLIIKLNKDDSVNGILLQLPLPSNLDINIASTIIDINKDVDCFNPYNLGLIFRGYWDEIINYPCTPYAVIQTLKYYKIKMESKNIVIIGRSNIVSKPLLHLLLKEDATVTICNSKTKNINQYLKKADIICSSAKTIGLINKSNIKKGAIIIDISINRDSNNMICGDAIIGEVFDKVKFITPVPGGIGLVTQIILFDNLIKLYKNQKRIINI